MNAEIQISNLLYQLHSTIAAQLVQVNSNYSTEQYVYFYTNKMDFAVYTTCTCSYSVHTLSLDIPLLSVSFRIMSIFYYYFDGAGKSIIFDEFACFKHL